jgi:hypothetical protein
LVTGVLGGAGATALYFVKRKLERQPERDAIAIEQTKVLLLQSINGMLEHTDPAVRERAAPVVGAMIETSLKALSAPPPAKKLTPEEQRRADEEQRKKQQAEYDEDRRKRAAESAARAAEHQESVIDFYRKPLAHNAMVLCIYAMKSAEQNVKTRDLVGFHHDWEMFKLAAGDWRRATHGKPEQKEADEMIADLDKRFRTILDAIDAALRKQSAPKEVTAGQ